MIDAIGAPVEEYLNSLLENDTFTDYGSEDFSNYDNKYAIYWYRFEERYVDPSGIKLMPDGWRLLSNEELRNPQYPEIPYISLPSCQKDKDGNDILDKENHKLYNVNLDDG
jgi:hypothetical protein